MKMFNIAFLNPAPEMSDLDQYQAQMLLTVVQRHMG